MAKLVLLWLVLLVPAACSGQNNQAQEAAVKQQAAVIGGPCEGCEAIYEYGDKKLIPVDTLPDFSKGETPLKITGTILQSDGVTPAAGVIMYVYHTNQEGIYPTRGGERGWGRRHGYLRGWIKTGADGKYTFYTQRPGAYPSRNAPAHIHVTLKEPGKNEYYIDDFLFADDPLLQHQPPGKNPKGGAGLVTLTKEGGLWVARRDIVLGLNIENYR